MKRSAFLAIAAIGMAAPLCARAQAAASPSPEALGLARVLVQKSGAGGQAAMFGLIIPPPAFLAELGISTPQQAQAVAHDAILPTLGDHEDQLTDIQVRSYASLLSVTDLKAAIAFYDSPAGRRFVQMRFRHLGTGMSEAAALIETLRPEIEAQAQVVAHAHGWPPG